MSAIFPLPGTMLASESMPSIGTAIQQGITIGIPLPNVGAKIMGAGAKAFGKAAAVSAWEEAISSSRLITAVLGVLLIAAALFTHPTVINVGKKAKKAGKAAAVAA